MKLLKFACVLLATVLLGACTGMPDKVTPVKGFDLSRYLGTWYEIARLDHSFERGLSNISATYSLNDDGTVKVINRGWNEEDQAWQQAEGKAKFVQSDDVGYLKVSFFGPFYGSYIVFDLKDDYSLALVSGPDTDYLWLLSRTPTIADDELQRAIGVAKSAGFDTSKLIFPSQEEK